MTGVHYTRMGGGSPLHQSSGGPYLPPRAHERGGPWRPGYLGIGPKKTLPAARAAEVPEPDYAAARAAFWDTEATEETKKGPTESRSTAKFDKTKAASPASRPNQEYTRLREQFLGSRKGNMASETPASAAAAAAAANLAAQREAERERENLRQRMAEEETRWQAEAHRTERERRQEAADSGAAAEEHNARDRRAQQKEAKKAARRRQHAENARMNGFLDDAYTPSEQPKQTAVPSAEARLAFTNSKQPIRYDQVPWLPLPLSCQSLGLAEDDPRAIRRAVKKHLRFWHPDRWSGLADRLRDGGESERVLARVSETARRLAELKDKPCL